MKKEGAVMLTEKAAAYAKINLFLDVCGKMANGYHKIDGVMQSISLFDTVSLTLDGSASLVVGCTDPSLPQGEKNIAFRAACRFFEATGERPGGKIWIEKRIPAAAGMAGGSADAAAVLFLLNKMKGFPLSPERLRILAASLGADVPFCLMGGTQRTQGVGELLSPLPALNSGFLVCVKGGEDVSTPFAYQLLDEEFDGFSNCTPHTERLTAMLEALQKRNLHAVADSLYNIFESAVLPRHSTAASLREEMTKKGALAAMMSGSGPSVFGIFAEKEKAENAAAALRQMQFSPFVCTPSRCGVETYQ